ncbi:MAG: hypothetical protein ACKOAU_00090 [Pirellula sp.]
MSDSDSQPSFSKIKYRGRLAILALGFLLLGGYCASNNPIYALQLDLLSPSICTLCVDVAIVWVAMQGPGRLRQTLWGVLYLFASVIIQQLISQLPYGIPYDTFFRIDLPATLLDLTCNVSLMKSISLLTGIEIIDRSAAEAGLRSRWTISRWLWLMFSIAVLLQANIARYQWYAQLSGANSGFVPGGSGIVFSQQTYIGNLIKVFALSQLYQSTLPWIAAAWFFSGRRWRLSLIPWLGFYIYAVKLFWVFELDRILITTPAISSSVNMQEFIMSRTSGVLLASSLAIALCQVAITGLGFWVGCCWNGWQPAQAKNH